MKRGAIILLTILLVMPVLIGPTSAFSFGFGDVKGKVTNSSGSPLSSVRVTLIYGGRTIDTDYTDSAGNYHVYYTDIIFSRISVLLKYQKSGYVTKTYGAYLYPGVTTTKNVVLPVVNTAPTQVTGLTATAQSSTEIDLDWNNNPETDVIKYQVYRNGAYRATVTGRTSSYFSDTGLNPLTTYTYKVRAVDSGGLAGPYSTEVSETTFRVPVWYALVVSGSDEGAEEPETTNRHPHDAAGMYYTLINHYGLTAENIHFLSDHDYDPINNNIWIPIDDFVSPTNVHNHIFDIASDAEVYDNVLIWWTGHGREDIFTCPTYNTGETVSASTLDNWLDTITCQFMYIYLGPCHSGSFVDNLDGHDNRAIYTSCASDEVGHANSEHSFWPWATYYALDPAGGATSADSNSDGRVSIGELFIYADYIVDIWNGPLTQTPQKWVGYLIDESKHFLGDGYY